MKSDCKVLALAATLTFAGATHAQAETVPAAGFNEADMQKLFVHNERPMQVAALSSVEMKQTEGEALPAVLAAASAIGGASGAASYMGSVIAGNDFSWKGLGAAAAGGAVGGLVGFGNPYAAATIGSAVGGGTTYSLQQK